MVILRTFLDKDGQDFTVNQVEFQGRHRQPEIAERLGISIEEYRRRLGESIPVDYHLHPASAHAPEEAVA